MSIQGNQFDEAKAKEALKSCPKIVQDYFRLLQYHLEAQKDLAKKAIGKIVHGSKGSSGIMELKVTGIICDCEPVEKNGILKCRWCGRKMNNEKEA